MDNFANWSDEVVLRECVRYGEEARRWRNRFLGLLPEVYRRKLYERHGCSSIFEFAYKVGGVSKEQVKRTLSLYDRFEEMPVLQKLLVSGVVSVNKMARVASVATKENEEVLANQVQLLSQASVETLVRDIRTEGIFVRTHSSSRSVQGGKPEPHHTITLAEDVQTKLSELQHKGIDINEELRDFLKQREERIQREKEELAEREDEKQKQEQSQQTRYIPARIRKVLQEEHGTKCSLPACERPATQIHHTQRYTLAKSHDPLYLAPLCKAHHEIAHAIDQKVQQMKRSKK